MTKNLSEKDLRQVSGGTDLDRRISTGPTTGGSVPEPYEPLPTDLGGGIEADLADQTDDSGPQRP